MNDVFIGIIVRPLAFLTLLVTACVLSKLLLRFIPPGRIKDILYKKRDLIRPVNRVER
jgi:hypothetical protein